MSRGSKNALVDIKALSKESRKLELLYVEDEQQSRDVIESMLKPIFKKLEVAKDGAEGLIKFKELGCDLIITDIKMPYMNGLEMIEEIRAIDREIPIVVLSAHSDMDYFLTSIDLGVDGYIIKPIKREQLLETLYRISLSINNKKELEKYRREEEERAKETIENQKEKISTQEQLLLKQSKMAIMGEMMRIITHQWSQPLSVISLGVMSVLEEMKDIEIEEKKKSSITEDIDSVVVSIDFMTKTMKSFKDYFKPTKIKKELLLKKEIDDVVSMLVPQLKIAKVIVTNRVPEEIKIVGISNELKQVILNLLANSRDAIKSSGKSSGDIVVEAKRQEDRVVISFCDNGGGIPEEIIDRVFDSDITTKGENGSGIGLYMSKMIIEESFGGKIEVKNNKEGACFIIEVMI